MSCSHNRELPLRVIVVDIDFYILSGFILLIFKYNSKNPEEPYCLKLCKHRTVASGCSGLSIHY